MFLPVGACSTKIMLEAQHVPPSNVLVSTGYLEQCGGQHRSPGGMMWSAQVTWRNDVVSTGYLEQCCGQLRSPGGMMWSAQVTWNNVVVSTGHLEQ